MPAEHERPLLQTLPHVPQWDELVIVFTQALLQKLWPLGQAHMPPEHERPPLHAMPHMPQLFVSVCKLTQAPLHAVRPAAQLSAQPPVEHT